MSFLELAEWASEDASVADKGQTSRPAAQSFHASCTSNIEAWNRVQANVVNVFSIKVRRRGPKYAETVTRLVGTPPPS